MSKISTTFSKFISEEFLFAILWYFLSLFISNINDIIQKKLGLDIHPIQITCLRFFFGTISLIPFFVTKKRIKSIIQTKCLGTHINRGLILFIGISLYCLGLKHVHLTVANLINFTIPMFVLILSKIILNEKVDISRWIATLLGFIGVLIVLVKNKKSELLNFNYFGLILLVSSLFFSILDISNKKYSSKEPHLTIIFYTALSTSFFSFVSNFFIWKNLIYFEYILVFFLGIGANLILLCLLKAVKKVDASIISPFRYLELVFSAITGFYFFNEIPSIKTILGSIIIIPCALIIVLNNKKSYKSFHSNKRKK
jgi:S-adenosylmethionine uptake transporter